MPSHRPQHPPATFVVPEPSTVEDATERIKRLQRHPTDLAMDTCSTTSVTNSILAGYAAGVSGTLVGHPFDSVKVWIQTGTTSTARKGFQSFYAGVAGPLVTVGMVASVNFAIYDSSRRMLHGLSHPRAKDLDYLTQDSIQNVGLASMTAGFILACFTSPLLIIKTKQQTQQVNFQTAFRMTVPRRMYAGFFPHVVCETLGRGVYFMTYETSKRSFENKLALWERMACGASSGILCWMTIYPFDAVRCRMFACSTSTSTLKMAKSMYEQGGGIRSFYRGFSVTLIRAGPVAAAVLPMYDMTLDYLSRSY
jgi:hypothetical protein